MQMDHGKFYCKALLLLIALLMAVLSAQKTGPQRELVPDVANQNFVIVRVGDFRAAIEWEDAQ
jgi:hypothetical protein